MTKRIFRTIFLVAVCVFLAAAILFLSALYNYFSDVQQSRLRTQTDLIALGVQDEGVQYLSRLSLSGDRVTWIGTDGSVLYDSVSDAGEMENHFAREEIKQALAEGYGTSARYSATLTERYLYSAKRLPDGTVIRLSVAQSSLLSLTLGMLQPILLLFALAILLSAVLASRLAKNIIKPLNALDLDKPLENEGYDELSPLLRRIDMQQKEIRAQGEELAQRRREFEVLTASMAEGIVLLNCGGRVVSINPAAARLLGAADNCIGEDVVSLNRTPALTGLLERAAQGERAETILSLGGGRYRAEADPVFAGEAVSGIVLLLLDMTERELAEQQRREFTANVSHELKTPLQTISGSAELLANGMVKPEDIPGFSRRIYSEAQRMIRLVEDILKLSHLDEGVADLACESVDLYALAEQTLGVLSDAARNAGVRLSLRGQAVSVYGARPLLRGIVLNLCDNAVKYNRRGGSVTVEIKSEGGDAVLIVADTGIGIPPEHQERIFERFYRVGKCRSKEIGGTGLGLSIVKHAARLLGAQISLHSVPNEGTTVSVRIPRGEPQQTVSST